MVEEALGDAMLVCETLAKIMWLSVVPRAPVAPILWSQQDTKGKGKSKDTKKGGKDTNAQNALPFSPRKRIIYVI